MEDATFDDKLNDENFDDEFEGENCDNYENEDLDTFLAELYKKEPVTNKNQNSNKQKGK